MENVDVNVLVASKSRCHLSTQLPVECWLKMSLNSLSKHSCCKKKHKLTTELDPFLESLCVFPITTKIDLIKPKNSLMRFRSIALKQCWNVKDPLWPSIDIHIRWRFLRLQAMKWNFRLIIFFFSFINYLNQPKLSYCFYITGHWDLHLFIFYFTLLFSASVEIFKSFC